MSPVANCRYTCREAKWRWQTAEILKHGNRRTCAEKGQDLMKTLDLIFNVSTRFRIHPCGERSERWNSQSRPVVVVHCTWIRNLWPELPRSKIEHQILSGTRHKPGSEWWQWSQYLCSVQQQNDAKRFVCLCIRETKYNWTSLPFVTTSARADCQIWLSSCKHLNVRLQFQKFSQLYTPHLWKSDHEAVARGIKHLALQYEVGGIWRDRYIWHEQRPVQTPQQQQEVNGFKDGSMVTRYTLDVCSSTLQCKLRDGKKMTKHEKTRQGRLPGRLTGFPSATRLWRSDSLPGSGSSPGWKRGSGASNDIKIGLQSKWREDVSILYRYVPISSRHWYSWNYVTVVFMVIHVVLGRLSSGQLANLNTTVLLRHLALQTKFASTGTYCLDLHIVQRIPVTATYWRHVKLRYEIDDIFNHLQRVPNIFFQMERIQYMVPQILGWRL